jgi:hypothetical protein
MFFLHAVVAVIEPHDYNNYIMITISGAYCRNIELIFAQT